MTEKLHFLYDGFLLIAELKLDTSSSATNSAPTIMRTYHWEPTQPVATRPLSLTRWTKQTSGATNVYSYTKENYFLTVDLQKNVSAILNNEPSYTSGTAFVLGLYRYDAFGNLVIKGWSKADDNPFRFSSEYEDEALGLIYYNYRHYNPHDGRWINRDPIAEQGGNNLYGFISNNTVNSFDSLGLKKNCPETYYVYIGGLGDFFMDDLNLPNFSPVKGNLYTTCSGPNTDLKGWTPEYEISENINRQLKDCPDMNIAIIGHSYGGDSAMNIADSINKGKGKLVIVTLDAVSQNGYYSNPNNPISNNIDYWINVSVEKAITSPPSNYTGIVSLSGITLGVGELIGSQIGGLIGLSNSTRDFSDLIAQTGGHWGSRHQANENIVFIAGSYKDDNGKAHHGNANILFKGRGYMRLANGKTTKASANNNLNTFISNK